MKKALISAAALALSAASAFAADLPSMKGPPPAYLPPPPPLWTGFYVGLNAGYTFSNSNTTRISAFDTGGFGFGWAQSVGGLPYAFNLKNDGFIGGGQIGYNWQFGPSFVAGLEADIQGIAGSGNSRAVALQGLGAVPVVTGASSSIDYLGTVRGRLGWLFTPTLLLYGTGGLAYAGVNSNVSVFCPTCAPPFAGVGAFSDTRVGWTAGGGVEWMFWPNWSAKAEYLYYDLGTTVVSTPAYVYGGNFSVVSATNRFDGHIVRAGLNYHFNWGAAPVVAKY